MKKLILTSAIILGISLTTFADGGLFQRGYNAKNGFSGYTYFGATEMGERTTDPLMPGLPAHGENTNQPAPVGSGIAVLLGLGAAYMVAKKRKED
ncbi:MAG: hypothetical protein IKO23_00985 [Bacteroidales bacterium]|jgi:hypothetical protein|nr:hypothetical protein [Bacteroidales bacterium]